MTLEQRFIARQEETQKWALGEKAEFPIYENPILTAAIIDFISSLWFTMPHLSEIYRTIGIANRGKVKHLRNRIIVTFEDFL